MYKLTAYQLHEKFCKKELSAEQIVRYFLKRIDSFDKKIGSFLAIYTERAIKKAQDLDKKLASGEPVGQLAAVIIAIKDNIHVKGEITTCASRFLTNYKAVFDSTVVRLLEEEDAIIIGKLNLDEFAMGSSTEHSALKETNNPWDLSCVPGGSSGGPAAAVAARLCQISLGSDTGGSVRHPAAFCGVLGLKPTYGRVSRFGLVAFGSSLDQIGPITTSADDMGMVMEVIGKHDPHDATSLHLHNDDYLSLMSKKDLKGRVAGVPWSFLESLSNEPKDLFLQSIKNLEKLGCKIVDVDLDILQYSLATYYIIATAEASTNLARFDGIRYGVRSKKAETLDQIYDYSRTEGFGSEVKKRIFLGTYVLSAGHQDAYYKKAMKVRLKIIDSFNKAFDGCDFIAAPVTPNFAFVKGAIRDPLEMYLQDIYTIGVNLAHLPAISIPCGFNSEDKPFGLQLIGNRRSDPFLCQAANAYTSSFPHISRIPPLFDREA